MNDMNKLKAKLGLPPISQIGVVVKGCSKGGRLLLLAFGVGPFTIYDFVPEMHVYNGEQTYAKVRMGKAMWNNMELELDSASGRKITSHGFSVSSEGRGPAFWLQCPKI